MTVQIGQRLLWGSYSFAIPPLPLDPVWQTQLAEIQRHGHGIEAVWRMRQNELFLTELSAGRGMRGRRSAEQILPWVKLPVVARWFSGEITIGGTAREGVQYRDTYTLHFTKGRLSHVTRQRDPALRFAPMHEWVWRDKLDGDYHIQRVWDEEGEEATLAAQLVPGDKTGHLELRIRHRAWDSPVTARRCAHPGFSEDFDICLPIESQSQALEGLMQCVAKLAHPSFKVKHQALVRHGEDWTMRFCEGAEGARTDTVLWYIELTTAQGMQLYSLRMRAKRLAQVLYFAVKRLATLPLYDPFFYESLRVDQALGLLVKNKTVSQLLPLMAGLSKAQWQRLRWVLLRAGFERMEQGSLRRATWQQYMAQARAIKTLPPLYSAEEWAQRLAGDSQTWRLKDKRRYWQLEASDGEYASFRPWEAFGEMLPEDEGDWDNLSLESRMRRLRLYMMHTRWPTESGEMLCAYMIPELEKSRLESMPGYRQRRYSRRIRDFLSSDGDWD